MKNVEASTLKKAFEDLEFAVLYFNSLSSESIVTLLEAISKVDYSQLLMIALVFLSKGKTAELYSADGVAMPYEVVFRHFQRCPIPYIYIFDSASNDEIHLQKENDSTLDDANESNSTVADTQNENDFNLPLHICPLNCLVLAARHNSASSPIVKEFTEKLSLSLTSVQECFKTICADNNSTTVKSIWHETAENDLFIVKSINDR